MRAPGANRGRCGERSSESEKNNEKQLCTAARTRFSVLLYLLHDAHFLLTPPPCFIYQFDNDSLYL